MSAGVVSIFNEALGAAGITANVSLENERSPEAETCRLYYQSVRRQVLSAANWSSTSRDEYLAVINERPDNAAWVRENAPTRFRFTYAQPNLCLRPQNLDDFSQFKLGVRAEQNALFSNCEDAILHFTIDEENTTLWDHQLRQTIVAALAAYITIPLTGDKSLARLNEQRANENITTAQMVDANSENETFETPASSHEARQGSIPRLKERYFYPFGSRIMVPAAQGTK